MALLLLLPIVPSHTAARRPDPATLRVVQEHLTVKVEPVPDFNKEVLEPLRVEQAREAARVAQEAADALEAQRQAELAKVPPKPVYTPPVYYSGAGGLLARIRMCESSGNYSNQDTGHNGHYGAYQFSPGTWASVGGSGNPGNASPQEQDMRAQLLMNSRGTQPWDASKNCWG